MDDIRRLLRIVKPYWLIFVLALLAMFLGAVFETAIGALLVPIFDQFLQNKAHESKTLFDLNSLIPRDDWYRAWIVISALLLGFTMLKGIAEYISAYFLAKIGQSAVLNLRSDLYDHLLRQPAVFFEKHRTNFLVSRLVVSCAAIELAVSSNLRDVLREAFMLVFFIGAAFYFNWRLTLGSLIVVPLIAYLTNEFSRRLRKLADVSLEGNKKLSDTSQEALSNHIIVKAYSAEQRERKRFVDVAGLISRANLRSASISATAPPTLEFIAITGVIVLFYFGLREINFGRMEPSQFFTFLFFLLKSYDPMRKISRQHNEVTKAFAAARDVWNVLDNNESLPEKRDAVTLGPLMESIKIDNVTFNYRSSKKHILKNIDLEIKKGAMVALVGESGGGKSSLTRLVQRLYDPTSGAIYWDGVDIRDATQTSLRKNIALVTQETVLFNDTIRQNIAYGKPDATDAEIQGAASIAFADEFISQLPQKYDTLVGERGVMLSGGQRQRIAIALI